MQDFTSHLISSPLVLLMNKWKVTSTFSTLTTGHAKALWEMSRVHTVVRRDALKYLRMSQNTESSSSKFKNKITKAVRPPTLPGGNLFLCVCVCFECFGCSFADVVAIPTRCVHLQARLVVLSLGYLCVVRRQNGSSIFCFCKQTRCPTRPSRVGSCMLHVVTLMYAFSEVLFLTWKCCDLFRPPYVYNTAYLLDNPNRRCEREQKKRSIP